MTSSISSVVGIPFSQEQLEAITTGLEPCVVIAGAGTGKTSVMAARVVWLVMSGMVRPEQVLGLTFTRKATAELSQRIESNLLRAGLVDAGDPRPTVATYDGFSAGLVDEYGAWLGVDSHSRLVEGARAHQLALEVVGGLDHAPLAASHLTPSGIAEAIVRLAGQMGSHDADAQTVRDADARWMQMLEEAPTKRNGDRYAKVVSRMGTVAEREELLDLVQAYRRLKDERGVVEFSDRMSQALELSRRRPRVGADLRSRYRVVLLDEYQDTSSAQAELLEHLFTGPDPQTGLGHPVTAVGDPLQAIYGWRGAAASNILSFGRMFRTASGNPARVLNLVTNRRSGRTIVESANDLSEDLRGELRTAHHEDESEGESDDGGILPLTCPSEVADGAVKVARHDTWEEECAAVADTIVEASARGTIAAWQEAAVLVRRNQDVPALHDALVARDVPVRVANLGGLLRLPDPAMVVAHLRVFVDRRNDSAVATLLSSPRFGLGTYDMAEVRRRARAGAARRARADGLDPEEVETHLCDALAGVPDGSGRVDAALRRLGSEVEELADHAEEGPDDLMLRIEEVTGLVDDLAADDPRRGRARRMQLDVLWGQIREACRSDAGMTVSGIVAWLDAEEDVGVGLSRCDVGDGQAVTISTVHGAKGLEWPLVVLPNMADGVFPSSLNPANFVTRADTLPSRARGDAADIAHPQSGDDKGAAAYLDSLREESRWAEDRLAYVACTRAKRVLVASFHTWHPGRKSAMKPSPYLLTLARRLGVEWPEDPGEPPSRAPSGVSWPVPGTPPVDLQNLARGAGPLDDPAEDALAQSWLDDVRILLADARRRAEDPGRTALPAGLTASQIVRFHRDPRALLDDLRRPMPRPADRGAGIGTAFHEWVSHRLDPDQETLFDADDVEGFEDDWLNGDEVIDAGEDGRPGSVEDVRVGPGGDDRVLQGLMRAWLDSRWANARVLAVEKPFVMTIGGIVVRGRLDAVVEDPDHPGCELVIDWKTSRPGKADPLQLSIYRLAWARARGLQPDRVRAVFHHVGANTTVAEDPLLTEDEVATILSGSQDGLSGSHDGLSGSQDGARAARRDRNDGDAGLRGNGASTSDGHQVGGGISASGGPGQ